MFKPLEFIRSVFAAKPEGISAQDRRVVSLETSVYGGATVGQMRFNPDSLVRRQGLQIYGQMRNDEQVKAVCTFKRDTIVSRGWIFSYPQTSKLSLKEQEARIDIFSKLLDQMPGSFVDGLNAISLGREYGFSLTEKVYDTYELDGKSWVGLSKLVARDPATFDFITDPYGELVRCEQVAAGQRIEIDLDKFVYYVHNPEFDPYFGRSDLRAAYRSWYFKNEMIKQWAVHMERMGSGFKVMKMVGEDAPRFGTPGYAALQTAIEGARAGASIIIPRGVELDIQYPSASDGFESVCTWHDLAIARALLVPNLLGVSHTGTTGAFAQSQTQMETFAWTVSADKLRLEACINEQLVRDLGDRNWGDGEYPQFEFNPISEARLQWMVGTWSTLLGASAVMPTKADEDKLRSILGMPKRDEKSELLKPMAVEAPKAAAEETEEEETDEEEVEDEEEADEEADEEEVEDEEETDEEEEDATEMSRRLLFNPNFDPSQPRADDGKWSDFYHATQKDYVQSIRKEGLRAKPANRNFDGPGGGALYEGERGESVYLGTKLSGAEDYARMFLDHAGASEVVILKFSVPENLAADFVPDEYGGGNAVRYRGNIDPKYLKSAHVVKYNIRTQRAGRRGHRTPLVKKKLFALAADDNMVTLYAVVMLPPKTPKAVVAARAHTHDGKPRSCSVEAFTRAVERVEFAQIERRGEAATAALRDDFSDIVARAVRRLLGTDETLSEMLNRSPEDISTLEFSGAEKGRLKDVARRALSQAYLDSTNMAKTEVRKARRKNMQRATFADVRERAAEFIEANAFRISGNVSDAARSIIQQELLNGVKFNKSPVEVRKAVWQRLLERGIAALRSIFAEETDEAVTEALDELWQDDEESAAAYLETVARTAMFESMNEARYAEFSSPEMSDFILALEYSSVLDDRTTEVCQYMDGRVYSSKSEVWNRLRPPNHYNCRSLLIPITQTDLDEGTWNGRESPPPAAEPQVGFK